MHPKAVGRTLAAALIAGLFGAPILSNPHAAVAAEPEKTGTDLGDVFGFTVPTDTLGKGEREVAPEAVGRFGKADGTYRVIETKTQIGFGVIDGVSVTPGLIGTWASSWHRIAATDMITRIGMTSLGGRSIWRAVRIWDTDRSISMADIFCSHLRV